MKLILLRHGKTEDRGRFSKSGHADELRPLSQEGRRDLRRASGGLAKLAGTVDRLITSPFVRAIETAAIFAKEFPKLKSSEAAELRPGSPAHAAARLLESYGADETILLVGHEPQLGKLTSFFLCGAMDLRPFMTMKRGGACLMEFPGKAISGRGTLLWLLTPRQLRSIAR